MMTKKQIKKNLKHTLEIESMLLMLLSNNDITDEEASLLTKELFSAADFIVRFKNALEIINREGE